MTAETYNSLCVCVWEGGWGRGASRAGGGRLPSVYCDKMQTSRKKSVMTERAEEGTKGAMKN